MRPLVIYHRSCADGAGAAYAAWLKFGEDAEYRPAQYGDPAPTSAECEGRYVFVLDFSYPRAELERMSTTARNVLVLDHHKTAEEDLRGLGNETLQVTFDTKRSGARMAHDYFRASYRERVDHLIDYIQDRDLWTWKLPESREVSAALAAHGVLENFRVLDTLAVPDLKNEGSLLLRQQDGLVKAICRNAREVDLDGNHVLAANTPVLQSEVAGELAAGRPFGVAWFISAEGKTIVSLRVRDGGFDVSALAKRFGGGGHAKAAGFATSVIGPPWPWSWIG